MGEPAKETDLAVPEPATAPVEPGMENRHLGRLAAGIPSVGDVIKQ
jgi:hypothetical protein